MKSPEDISQRGLLMVLWLGFAIATILTAFRLYVRRTRLGKVFWDDAIHLLGWILLLASAIVLTIDAPVLYVARGVSAGHAPLTIEFLQKDAPIFIRYEFISILLFWSTIWAIKFAFLLFYRRFFTDTSHMVAWWAIFSFTTISFICCWLPFLYVCGSPKEYFRIGQCFTKRSILRTKLSIGVSTAVDILTDLMIMALPLRILWNLRITRRQKLGLATIFSLATIVIIFAVVRAVETSSTLTPSALVSLNGGDPISLTLFSTLESTIAVIVSCLPTFRVFILGHQNNSNNRPSDAENPRISPSNPSSGVPSDSRIDRPSSLLCGLPISRSKGWARSHNARRGTREPLSQEPKDAQLNSYRSYEPSAKKSARIERAPQSQRNVESDQTLVGTPLTDFRTVSPNAVARDWPNIS